MHMRLLLEYIIVHRTSRNGKCSENQAESDRYYRMLSPLTYSFSIINLQAICSMVLSFLLEIIGQQISDQLKIVILFGFISLLRD